MTAESGTSRRHPFVRVNVTLVSEAGSYQSSRRLDGGRTKLSPDQKECLNVEKIAESVAAEFAARRTKRLEASRPKETAI